MNLHEPHREPASAGDAPTRRATCPPAASWPRSASTGYLVAGVNAGAYKFGYLNPATGNIEGFEIDLVNELAKAIFGTAKGHVRLVALTVPQRFTAVEDGKVDIVVDAITITCYAAHAGRLLDGLLQRDADDCWCRLNSGVKDISALAHKRVCATAASTPIDVMKAMPPSRSPESPSASLRRSTASWPCSRAQGTIAAISTDSSILLGFKAQDPNTQIVGASLGKVPYGMAISKAHPDFVRFVNGVLAEIERNGTWQQLQAKWLGQFHQLESTPTPQYDG